jgi:hypothetical protein
MHSAKDNFELHEIVRIQAMFLPPNGIFVKSDEDCRRLRAVCLPLDHGRQPPADALLPEIVHRMGIVREKSITLPERQNRILSPLISLDFSDRSE